MTSSPVYTQSHKRKATHDEDELAPVVKRRHRDQDAAVAVDEAMSGVPLSTAVEEVKVEDHIADNGNAKESMSQVKNATIEKNM